MNKGPMILEQTQKISIVLSVTERFYLSLKIYGLKNNQYKE